VFYFTIRYWILQSIDTTATIENLGQCQSQATLHLITRSQTKQYTHNFNRYIGR
jgi:uncharacterized membrane protein YwzB